MDSDPVHFRSLQASFLENFRRYGDEPAILFLEADTCRPQSYRAFGDICTSVAHGLLQRGIKPGDRAVILSQNRPEWAYADIGALLAGCVTSAIYPQSLSAEIAYILNDLEARVLFMEDEAQLEKLLPVRDMIPSLAYVFVFSGRVNEDIPGVFRFEALLEATAENQERLDEIARSHRPHDPLCIIYTSGTTGVPKGVVLTQQNYLATMASVLEVIPDHAQVRRYLSFLPLAHAFERMVGHYFLFYLGRAVGYAERMETIIDNCKLVRPNLLAAVPRFFEKVHSRIQNGLQEASWLKRALFHWALQVGERRNRKQQRGERPNLLNRLEHALAERLIYRKVQAAFGGDVRYFVSGGAPLNPMVGEFFQALGMIVLEGWGATEVTAPACINRPWDNRIGTVGPAIPGVEVRLAADGELEVKGPNVFKGYWRKPQETREAFTADGYYRTGDIGTIAADGWVRITGRKKELIITAGGKNVAPAAIVQLLINQPHIDMAYIHGDRRKYLTALLVPDAAALAHSARQLHLPGETLPELLAHPQLRETIDREVQEANRRLPRFMQVRYYRILAEPFSVENGELTHTLKLRTEIVEEKYKQLLDSMYDE